MRKLCTRLISGYAKTLTKHGFICERKSGAKAKLKGASSVDDGICFLTCLIFLLAVYRRCRVVVERRIHIASFVHGKGKKL